MNEYWELSSKFLIGFDIVLNGSTSREDQRLIYQQLRSACEARIENSNELLKVNNQDQEEKQEAERLPEIPITISDTRWTNFTSPCNRSIPSRRSHAFKCRCTIEISQRGQIEGMGMDQFIGDELSVTPERTIRRINELKIELMALVDPRNEIEMMVNRNETFMGSLSPSDELEALGLILDRNKLARKMRLARICWSQAPNIKNYDGQAEILYLLERLVNEANTELRSRLELIEAEQELILAKIWLRITDENLSSLDDETDAKSNSNLQLGPRFRRHRWPIQIHSRKVHTSSSGDDSGIERDSERISYTDFTTIDESPFDANRLSVIDESIKFKACKQTQNILKYSIDFLEGLIDQSALFKPMKLFESGSKQDNSMQAPQVPMSCQQLKLFVCVEAQKLRSLLRFVWLPRCLELAFESFESNEAPARSEIVLADWISKGQPDRLCGRPRSHRLPALIKRQLLAISSSDNRRTSLKYLSLLALLLGQLLRRHFLEAALDRWTEIIKSLRWPDTSEIRPTMLRIQVELDEREAQSDDSLAWVAEGRKILVCSPIKRQLKATASFVVDELASVCCRLPRFEQQLEISWRRISTKPDDLSNKFITTLPLGDELLETAKQKLESLIDEALMLDDRCGIKMSDLEPQPIDPTYSLTLELVNLFRLGADISEKVCSTWHSKLQSKLDQSRPEWLASNRNANTGKLTSNCKQIHLLDLALNLIGTRSRRFGQFGQLVSLDFQALKESLTRNLQKERLILVRLELDDQDRLMEQLRLQLDEIEFNIDLDAAIEDHLNERWQARQNQQLAPAEQLLDGPESGGFDNRVGSIENDDEEMDDRMLFETAAPTLDDEILLDSGTRDSKDSAGYQHETELNDVEHDFVNALWSGAGGQTSGQRAAVLALTSNAAVSGRLQDWTTGTSGGVSNVGPSGAFGSERHLVPVIECQLLTGRLEYLARLFKGGERDQLARTLELAFDGLSFMSELVTGIQLEPNQLELVGELAVRAGRFNDHIGEACRRLEQARRQLNELHRLRSRVASKLVLEFHLLMVTLGQRRLSSVPDGASKEPEGSIPVEQARTDVDSERQMDGIRRQIEARGCDSIVDLDLLQENADLASKLAMRFKFLVGQNSLLTRENVLLSRAASLSREVELHRSNGTSGTEDARNQHCSTENEALGQSRSKIVGRWRHLVNLSASFWQLAQEFETQQVKWINSDTKRIDFSQVEIKFNSFVSSFKLLEQNFRNLTFSKAEQAELGLDSDTLGEFVEAKRNLEVNLVDLESRLQRFEDRRLPLFHLLTNRHLSERHLLELASKMMVHLDPKETVKLLSDCNTLDQMLKLNIDQHIDLIKQLDRQAKLESDLNTLVRLEKRDLGSDDKSEELLQSPFWTKLYDQSDQPSSNRKELLDLDGWIEPELALAAARIIQIRVSQLDASQELDGSSSQLDYRSLASELVRVHSFLKRFLRLSSTLNFQGLGGSGKDEMKSDFSGIVRLIKSVGHLASDQQLKAAHFIEFVRLFAISWIERKSKLKSTIESLRGDLERVNEHLREINMLTEKVETLEDKELHDSCKRDQKTLIELERKAVKLELEKEILATRESQAIEEQREASKIRDDCIHQIHQRAIPAIRASSRALDRLDERWLRALRSFRPRPPKTIRLVIEAVCLLRSASQTKGILMQPDRHFDALTGRMLVDYWPSANRMLNGTHHIRFIQDLRQVSQRNLPVELMHLIRREYLSSPLFNLSSIGRVSADAAQLARWLIAVDVFDRVIKVVKPNYSRYLVSEKRLNQLLSQVESRRHQLELVEKDLRRMEESYQRKIGRKVALSEALDQCRRQLDQVEGSRAELEAKKHEFKRQLRRLLAKENRLASKCLYDSAKIVYLESIPSEEERSRALNLLRALLLSKP